MNNITKNTNQNARKALDDLKMEIANELNIKLADVGEIGKNMTKCLVEMGERQLIKRKDSN